MNFNFTSTDQEKHSAAHVVATAVKRLFPAVRVGVGPVTKNGFYYDFELSDELNEDILRQIEDIANQIITEDLPFKQIMLNRDAAQNMLLQIGQIYKAELIQSIPDEEISFYKTGEEFIDLCRGPHVVSTSQLGYIKLDSIEDSNWNDDENRPKLKRIVGMLFKNVSEYQEYVNAMTLVKERDFIKIGVEKNIFVNIEDNTLNLSSRGTTFYSKIFQVVLSSFKDFEPQYINTIKNKATGFHLIDNDFKQKTQSFKSLPLSYFTEAASSEEFNDQEFSTNKLLLKTYLAEDQVSDISINYIEALLTFVSSFNENLKIELLSTNLDHPLITSLSNYLQKKLVSHSKVLTPLVETSFLEIKFILNDSINKSWEILKVEFKTNEEGVVYMNSANTKSPAYSIENSISIFMIMAYLMEEKKFDMPLHFHPIFSRIIPISRKHYEYCLQIKDLLASRNLTCEVDNSSKSIKTKIWNAEKLNVPFILIIGNKEHLNKAISLRREGKEVGLFSLEDVLQTMHDALDN